MLLAETKSLEQALNEAFHKADDLKAPLDERLKLYLGESRKLLPDLESTYDQLVARIQANSADVLVPAVGDKLPDFLMTDNRNERLDSSDGSMPWILWFVIIIGGLITLGYPAFFGSTNAVAQILMTAALAELVALAMLLGLAFDYPFAGDARISPAPFDHALRQMPPIWPPP